jgi:hypothetical protein
VTLAAGAQNPIANLGPGGNRWLGLGGTSDWMVSSFPVWVDCGAATITHYDRIPYQWLVSARV